MECGLIIFFSVCMCVFVGDQQQTCLSCLLAVQGCHFCTKIQISSRSPVSGRCIPEVNTCLLIFQLNQSNELARLLFVFVVVTGHERSKSSSVWRDEQCRNLWHGGGEQVHLRTAAQVPGAFVQRLRCQQDLQLVRAIQSIYCCITLFKQRVIVVVIVIIVVVFVNVFVNSAASVQSRSRTHSRSCPMPTAVCACTTTRAMKSAPKNAPTSRRPTRSRWESRCSRRCSPFSLSD